MEYLVSICIPTYNGAKYLRKCLDSAISQTFSSIEILVVDDCSSDETFAIANSYARQDRRIRLVRNEHNLGLVGNWNRCIELARGEWIKFLFQDDILEPECIEKMFAASRTDSSMIVCRRKFIIEDEPNGSRKGLLKYMNKYNMDKIFPGMTEISSENFRKAVVKNPLKNFVGEPTAVMLHRSVFHRFGLFNVHLIQICDIEYWIRVGLHTGLIYVPEDLAQFRIHSQGTTASNRGSKWFRWDILDPLICYHDFLFNPIYEPLRFYVSQQEPSINFQELFWVKIRQAINMTKQNNKNQSSYSMNCLEEFNEIMRFYPAIKLFKDNPIRLKFQLYKRKFEKLLTRIVGR